MWEAIWFIFTKILYITLLYYLFSIMFFIMPVFHIKNNFRPGVKRTAGIWTIAHRGGSQEGLENTLPTFRKAVKAGVDVLEMDIHLTKDKKAVVCHDSILNRLCGTSKSVKDFNYSELPLLQENIDLHFSMSQYSCTGEDDRHIPLLESIMEEFPETPFNMELKDDSNELKTIVLKLIRKYKREHLTIWGSVKESHNQFMKAMAPDIPNFAPIGVVMKIFLYFFIGFLPFYNIPYDTFQFPYVNPDYVQYKQKYEGSSLKTTLYILALRIYNLLGILIFFHLRRRNIFVFLYSVNNENDWDYLMKTPIDGIITDTPQKLLNHLDRKYK